MRSCVEAECASPLEGAVYMCCSFYSFPVVERPWLEYGEMDRKRRCTSIVSSRQVCKHNAQHVLRAEWYALHLFKDYFTGLQLIVFNKLLSVILFVFRITITLCTGSSQGLLRSVCSKDRCPNRGFLGQWLIWAKGQSTPPSPPTSCGIFLA